jgi:hypothetical protein
MAEVLAFVILVGLMLVPTLNVLVGAVVGAVLSGPLGAVFGLVTGCGLSAVIAKDRMRTRRRGNGARHVGALPLRLHRTAICRRPVASRAQRERPSQGFQGPVRRLYRLPLPNVGAIGVFMDSRAGSPIHCRSKLLRASPSERLARISAHSASVGCRAITRCCSRLSFCSFCRSFSSLTRLNSARWCWRSTFMRSHAVSPLTHCACAAAGIMATSAAITASRLNVIPRWMDASTGRARRIAPA